LIPTAASIGHHRKFSEMAWPCPVCRM
jgi:hypothetical protein